MHQTNFKSDLRSRVEDAKEHTSAAAAHERNVYRVVDVRDKWECRACQKKADPNGVGLLQRAHHHHVIYRSAGGPTETWNVCLVCAGCHDEEHIKRTLQIEGNADEGLTLWRKDDHGVWYVWRREIAVGRFERD